MCVHVHVCNVKTLSQRFITTSVSVFGCFDEAHHVSLVRKIIPCCPDRILGVQGQVFYTFRRQKYLFTFRFGGVALTVTRMSMPIIDTVHRYSTIDRLREPVCECHRQEHAGHTPLEICHKPGELLVP